MILDPRHYRLDELLRRPYTATTPFGSSGDCVWATSPQGWGFRNGVHWVHPGSPEGLAPFTLNLLADGDTVEPGDALYRPSHVTLHGRHSISGLQITEDKFITRDDVVVSVLSLRNPGDDTVSVEIDCRWGVPQGENEFWGVPVSVRRASPPGDDLLQRLPPGARRTLIFAVAFAPTREEAGRRVDRWARGLSDPVRAQADAYQGWFDEYVPRFDCSDPWLTKLWYHHWYAVRKNLLRPAAGLMEYGTFSQGRWTGREDTGVEIRLAHAVLSDVRWLRSPVFGRDYYRGLAFNRLRNGRFRSFFLDRYPESDADRGTQGGVAVARGLRAFEHIHPNRAFHEEALPVLQEFAAAAATAEATDSAPVAWQTVQDGIRSRYEEGDFARPRSGKEGDTDHDRFSEAWADRVIRLLGLVPRDDDLLELDPRVPASAEGGWSHFCLEEVPYRGHLLTLVWDDPADPSVDAYHDGDKGFTIYADGRRLHHQDALGPLTVSLPD